jgi:hypothetical protein
MYLKIDRNPGLFPKKKNWNGIVALSLCEFKYDFVDFNGEVKREPGYAMARPISGQGPWHFHDFLPHTRPPEWGKRCLKI